MIYVTVSFSSLPSSKSVILIQIIIAKRQIQQQESPSFLSSLYFWSLYQHHNMSAQSAEHRLRSVTTIIRDLRVAGLWLEEDNPEIHRKSPYRNKTQILNSLCNILVRSPGDVVAALIAVQQSGVQLLVAESSSCILNTNSKEL